MCKIYSKYDMISGRIKMNKMTRLFLTITGLMLCLGMTLAAQNLYMSVSGYVRDAETGKPLRNLNVIIYDDGYESHYAKTDRSGYFCVDKLRAGRYSISTDYRVLMTGIIDDNYFDLFRGENLIVDYLVSYKPVRQDDEVYGTFKRRLSQGRIEFTVFQRARVDTENKTEKNYSELKLGNGVDGISGTEPYRFIMNLEYEEKWGLPTEGMGTTERKKTIEDPVVNSLCDMVGSKGLCFPKSVRGRHEVDITIGDDKFVRDVYKRKHPTLVLSDRAVSCIIEENIRHERVHLADYKAALKKCIPEYLKKAVGKDCCSPEECEALVKKQWADAANEAWDDMRKREAELTALSHAIMAGCYHL